MKGNKDFYANCLYIPLAPADSSDPKAPNTNPKWEGPTVKSWSVNGKGLYSYEEKKNSDWDRWGIVSWSGEKKLLIIDIDLYKMDEKEKKEVEGANYPETRIHKSQSGGLHFFYLVEPKKLKAEFKNSGEAKAKLPVKLREYIDDKLNGYVVGPSVEGYEVKNDVMPVEIDPETDIPEEWFKEEPQPREENRSNTTNSNTSIPEELDEEELKERLKKAKEKDEKFKLLWEGKFTEAGYPNDRSKAEFVLANKIRFWFGQDEKTIRELMDKANTKKWPERKDEGYRNSIIEEALEGETYGSGPFRFFNDEHFVPKRLSDEIMEDVHFAVNKESGEIYYYEEGVYKEGGEGLIKELADKKLDVKAKNHYVNETVERIRNHYSTRTDTEKFKGNKDHLVVENGILDIQKRELRDHTPEEIHLSKLPVEYDPKADCPEIKNFIKSLFEDEKNVKKVQEMIGYTLLKDNRLNKMFMGLGPGGNGRSTLFELLREFLGPENTASVDLADLVYDKFSSSDLFGKLANFCADISNRKIKHSGRVKTLVGEDVVRGQKKHKDAFHFKNYATPWFSANELPQTLDKTRSFFRRWVILNFPYTFTDIEEELEKEGYKRKNPDFPEVLLTNQELSGLLNWALDGLEEVLENGKFTNERGINEKRELWLKESDPVREFIEEWCIEDPDAEMEKDIIRTVYRRFCLKNDYNLLPAQTLTKRLKKHGVETSRPRTEEGRVQCYKGIYIDPENLKDNKELVKVVKPSFMFSERYENLSLDNSVDSEYTYEQKSDNPDHPDQSKSLEEFENTIEGRIKQTIKDLDSGEGVHINEIDDSLKDDFKNLMERIDQLKEEGVLMKRSTGRYSLNE